jgi:D-glycero-alpha-D-manno-heptose-7-phosphate kinase
VSFAGGGSDLPAWTEKGEMGAVTSAAIGAYVYVAVNRYWSEYHIRLSYSKTEIVNALNGMEHDLVRESLRWLDAPFGLEISTLADVPGHGSGLGSSSAVTVGVIHALAKHIWRKAPGARYLAEAACEVELDRLDRPGGKQDQYACAFGGFNHMQFLPTGDVNVEALNLSPQTEQKLSKRLVLYRTAFIRDSQEILEHASERIKEKRYIAAEVGAMVGLATQAREALVSGKLDDLGYILGEGWERKRRLSDRISNDVIDEMYAAALDAGALGGKLCGAGAGGFLLMYVPLKAAAVVDMAMQMYEVRPLRVQWGVEGSRVMFDDKNGTP